MRLEAVRLPDASHARLTYAGHRCHAACAPMRRVIRTLLRRQCHNGLDLARGDLRLAPGLRLIPLDARHTVSRGGDGMVLERVDAGKNNEKQPCGKGETGHADEVPGSG